MPSLRVVDHRTRNMARQLHAVQMLAYAQEAALLGVDRFPPLEQTVEDLTGSTDEFVGAFVDDVLVGAVAVGRDDEGPGETITSLVVHPAHQRRGIGRSLLRAVIARGRASGMTVQTAAGNMPALALYGQFGFRVYRRWFVGREPIELVKLRRDAEHCVMPANRADGAER